MLFSVLYFLLSLSSFRIICIPLSHDLLPATAVTVDSGIAGKGGGGGGGINGAIISLGEDCCDAVEEADEDDDDNEEEEHETFSSKS